MANRKLAVRVYRGEVTHPFVPPGLVARGSHKVVGRLTEPGCSYSGAVCGYKTALTGEEHKSDLAAT